VKDRKIPFYLYPGLVMLLGMQLCIIFGISVVTSWATPVFWSGLILVLDGWFLSARGKSLISSGKIFPVAIISIVSWWVFEWFNIFLSNWHYINMPSPLWVRYLAYLWSFATIAPGVLLMYGVLSLYMKNRDGRPIIVGKNLLVWAFLVGFIFLAIPIFPFSMLYVERAAQPDLFACSRWFANPHLSEFTAPFVWTGFVLLIEPMNYLLGNPCILRSLENGNYKTLVVLSLAGFICGILWEYWNYWAYSKWYYTVPIGGDVKIFEMPVLGYLGFIPFAWEIYAIVSLLSPGAIAVMEDH
jgi:hypothetical protein